MLRRGSVPAYVLPGGSGFAPGAVPPVTSLSMPAVLPGVVSRCPQEERIGDPTPEEALAQIDPLSEESELVRDLFRASYELVWYNQPSPLVEPPFRADVLDQTFARVMIAPPTAPGDAAGATGAAECAAAEAAISGVAVPVRTPATTVAFVNVLQFQVPANTALYLHSIGAWGHDFLAAREVIRWRVLAGGKVVTSTRELGLLGSPDTPVRVHAILGEQNLLQIECQNLDARSGSLVEVVAFGWIFPVLRSPDSLRALLDPTRGPKDAGRFGPGVLSGGSGAGAGGPTGGA